MLGLLSEGHTQYLAYISYQRHIHILTHIRDEEKGGGRKDIDLRRLMASRLDFNEGQQPPQQREGVCCSKHQEHLLIDCLLCLCGFINVCLQCVC